VILDAGGIKLWLRLTTVEITDNDAFAAAYARVHALLDAERPADAIAFAETCTGHPVLVIQIRALACTYRGAILHDRETLLRGAELWRTAGAEEDSALGYNLAVTELDLWKLAIEEQGFVPALEGFRSHLQDARTLLRRAGDDETLPAERRVQALTNLANCFDSMGRDVDALAAYERALAIDPRFGMAAGNKALTLLGIAPFVREHQATLLAEALDAFDAALKDRDRILEIGGSHALECFERGRARINPPDDYDGKLLADRDRSGWQDPYLGWCAQHALFLHVSLRCLSETYDELDPLFFGGITVGISDDEQRRAKDLLDAFNAVKPDYVAARYLLWLADGEGNPIREHAAAVSGRTGFLDSLRYARWGVRTGIAVQAFTPRRTSSTRSRASSTSTTEPRGGQPPYRSVPSGTLVGTRTSPPPWTQSLRPMPQAAACEHCAISAATWRPTPHSTASSNAATAQPTAS